MHAQQQDVERAHTHVCLVSAQATPNLLPLMDPALAPRRVVMLVSEDMRQRAQWLMDVVRPRGIAVETLPVTDAWDMHGICDLLVDWLDKQADGGRGVVLNVTGGTKPMAMAAQQAFAMAGLPVFYVHHERDELQWLTPRLPATRLNGPMRLESFLHAHGWSVLQRPVHRRLTATLRGLTKELVMQAGVYEQGLGRLNWYAHQCEANQSLSVEVDERDLAFAGFANLLDKFATAGALQLDGATLRFPDEEARFFCNGGWLEDYVAEVVQDLRAAAGIQDVAVNLKVRTLDNRLRGDAGSNELDVVFLARHRLHIVECKTRSFRERHSAAEAVYKLDSLTALGGLNTRGMLVSYRRLMDGDRQRAADLRIRTIVGGAIANLRNELLRWIGPQ
jgi:hypothetical protein